MNLRFSIRALLVAMTLFAIWCGYHLNWIRQRRELIASRVASPFGLTEDAAPGFLWMFGEQAYHQIVVDLPDGDPEIDRIRTIFPEAQCDGYVLLGKWKPPQINPYTRGPRMHLEEEDRLGVAGD